MILDFCRPGKPTDNAFIETFNARVRLECLNQHWFLDLDDARTKIELWRQDYNDVRPHSAIGESMPMAVFTAHTNGPMGSGYRKFSFKLVQIFKADHSKAIHSHRLVQKSQVRSNHYHSSQASGLSGTR